MKKIILAILIIMGFSWEVSGGLIVNHNAVQAFKSLSSSEINAAKNMTVLYGHTSHGSQIISGLSALNSYNNTLYSVQVQDEGNAQNSSTKTPYTVNERLQGLDAPSGVGDRLWITREGAWPYGWWSTSTGLEATKALLRTGYFKTAGFAFCGQVANCPSYLNCNNDQYIYDYINAMEELEAEFPDVKIFYFTGHTVNPNGAGNSYTDLLRRNQIIRDYCIANNKILFDFFDIETHDLKGNFSPTNDDCEWCSDWCSDNPGSFECQLGVQNWAVSSGGCGSLGACSGKCAHSHGINCLIKAEAFWWMMSQLATGGTSPLDLPTAPKGLRIILEE